MQWTKASAGALYSAFGETDLLRWTTAMSSARLRARERAEEGGKERERVRGYGGAWRLPGHPNEEGRGQAGREAGGVARWRARASGTCLADWRQEAAQGSKPR